MNLAIAWHNLRDRRLRTLAVISGLTMSVLLMYLQLGFVAAGRSTASVYLRQLDGDIVLTSPHYVQAAESYTFPKRRLSMALATPGVVQAVPVYSAYGKLRVPDVLSTTRVQLLGFIPGERIFSDPRLAALDTSIRPLDSAVLDDAGRQKIAPELDGKEVEVNHRNITLRGRYALGGSFIGDTTLLVSADTFSRLNEGFDLDQVHIGLLRLAPGANRAAVIAELRRQLPIDVRVTPREEWIAAEEHYWVDVKPVGIMFRFGVIVAFVVGAVLLYQMMTAEVTNRRREFATLKTVGFSDAAVFSVIASQAGIICFAAFAPGTVLAVVTYAFIEKFAGVTVAMTAERLLLVLGLVLVLGVAAAMGAIQRFRKADLAELF